MLPILKMVAKVYNSFAVTISLDVDFCGPIEEWFTSWLKKQDYAFGVIERRPGSGILHAHAQVWNESPSRKGDLFGTAFKQKILKYAPTAQVIGNRGALNSEIAYNDVFVEYMEKDIVKELYSKLPQLTDKYYPSKEEQEKVMAKANAVDQKYHNLLVEFKESEYWVNEHWTPTLHDCGIFLSDMMFNKKKIRVVEDPKRKRELCKGLYHYCNGSIVPKEFMSQKDYDSWKNKYNPTVPGTTPDCPHACSCCPYYGDN